MIIEIQEDGTMITREPTPEEAALLNQPIDPQLQIQELKRELEETDYKAIKYAEGWLTEEEYTPVRAEREALRVKIRELENE